MDELKLKQQARIKATGVVGVVNAIWQQVDAATKYEVVYYDGTGRRAESWFRAEEIEAL